MKLETLYREHKAALTARLAAYSRDRNAAEDAVQQAYLKALQSAEFATLPERAMVSWLYTTARNALTDEKRRMARLTAFDPDYDAPTNEPDADDMLFLQELLEKLSPEHRQIVTLRYLTGLNATQIGQMLSLPAATVRTRLRAAIKRLKAELP
ncbi:MAG: RNA polymerase sigma factor [Oscillospiraceae bacterium]|jgi:RNA polymerase sigma-70 factor (ECF subfamily)|nr:RNA polymerase sigma factor [Oscillospiraceae bacterium]